LSDGQCQKVAEKEDEQKAPPASSGQNPAGEKAQIVQKSWNYCRINNLGNT